MNRTHLFCTLFLLSLSSLSLAAMNPIILQPFTFAGRVTDYAHCGYDADQKVEIRAKTEDGTLVAKTTTATNGRSAYNFVLDIPLASAPCEGHVTPGTQLFFEFADPDGVIYDRLVSALDAKVGASGELRELHIALASDADGDGIPDEYVEWLSYLMWINEKEVYDPDADWDGDQKSNRDEYIAGTNPFDAKDCFSLKEMAVEAGYDAYLKFTFLANQGRSYSVDTTFELKDASWRSVVFIDGDDGAEKSRINISAAKAAAYRSIYVLKENVKQQFWKLKVE